MLCHVTSAHKAQEILASGFRDAITKRGPGIDGIYPAGVWLSNRPLDPNDGVIGDSVLLVCFRIPLRRLREFEWAEDGGESWQKLVQQFLGFVEIATRGVKSHSGDDKQSEDQRQCDGNPYPITLRLWIVVFFGIFCRSVRNESKRIQYRCGPN